MSSEKNGKSGKRKRPAGGGRESNGKRLRLMDTEPVLRKDISDVKNKRTEKHAVMAADRKQPSRMTLNQKVESSRRHFLNDDLDPGVTPGTRESKLRYGAREPLAPVMNRKQYEEHNPSMLYDVPDIDEDQCRSLAALERESLDNKRIASHFMSARHFQESSPNALASVSLTSSTKSKRALQSDSTAEAPGKTDSTRDKKALEAFAAASGRKTDHQKHVAHAMAIASEEGRLRRKKNRERNKRKALGEELPEDQEQGKSATLQIPEKHRDDPALFGGFPESSNDFAVLDWRGLYKAAKSDIELFSPLEREHIKPRQSPEDFMIPTDAPTCGNANLVAARRSLVRNRSRFEQEGDDAVDNSKQSSTTQGAMPAVTASGVPLAEIGGIDPTSLFALEGRDVKVVDRSVYDDKDDEVQHALKKKGDIFAAEMAERHRRTSSLPKAGIEDRSERLRELGHDPTLPTLADMAETDELKGLPVRSADEDSTVQALIRYPGRFREKATDIARYGMVEQLIFDHSGYLGNLTPKVQRWKEQRDAESTSEELPRTDATTGTKVLTDEAKRFARNVKQQREVVGDQGSFDPPRRRVRFQHNKTRYCLDLLRKNDIFFANDRVKFAGGKAMLHEFSPHEEQVEKDGPRRKANIVYPDRSEPTGSPETTQRLLESSRGGLIGSLCDRILREKTENHAKRMGTDYFASSYELGTDRLHPSCNPDIVTVDMQYHLRYMEQARPDLRAYERECVRGENCWCYSRNKEVSDNGTYFLAKNAMSFICKEGLLPHEETEARTLGKLPEKRKPCFLCQMQEVTQRVASLQYEGTVPSRPLNDHCVRVGEPGQYTKENCLPVTYNRSNKRLPTGIVGFYPQFNEICFRHAVRMEGSIEIRYVSYSPRQALGDTLAPFLVSGQNNSSIRSNDAEGANESDVGNKGRPINDHFAAITENRPSHSHLHVDTHGPTYSEERKLHFNIVLGLRKLDPLVDAVYDPVNEDYMSQSHSATVGAIFGGSKSLVEASVVEELVEDSIWFKLEIASQRGVCTDRFHVQPSFRVALWDIEHFESSRDHERSHLNRNIPAVLLRRILRTEIAKEETPRVCNFLEEICRGQELYRAHDARYNPLWPPRPDNLSPDTFWHIADMHYTLAPFTETSAYLFPPLDRKEAVGLAIQSLRAVLGRTEHVFETYRIPPPSDDCFTVLCRMIGDEQGASWYPYLCAHYQLYTALLWRVVKAHRLQAALKFMIDYASHHVLGEEYCADHLRLIEYRVQLFIDTHVRICAYSFGDGGCWTDGEWLLGPGNRDTEDADVSAFSPITRFYPHCRNVLPCESEMPNSASVIDLGNLRYDVNVKPAQPTQRQAFIHLFACKLMPNRCLVRNFAEIVTRYIDGCETKKKKPDFLGYPSAKQYVVMILCCGLLGNWKMCDVRANFSKRIELEYSFMPLKASEGNAESEEEDEEQEDGSPSQDEDFEPANHPTGIRLQGNWREPDSLNRWINKHEMLTFYLFKEAYVHLVEKRSSLDIVLNRNMRWGHYKKVVRACTDRVRSIHNKDGGVASPASAEMDWISPLDASPPRIRRKAALFMQMEKSIGGYHKLAKNCFIKLRKGPFVRVLLKQMNSAASKIREGRLSEETLLAQRNKDMSFFQIADKDEADDDDDDDDDDDGDGPAARSGSKRKRGRGGRKTQEKKTKTASRNADDDMESYLAAEMDEESTGRAGNDEEESLRQERNLVAIAKFVRDLSKITTDVDLDLMDMVARDVMRRHQASCRIELHWLVELFGVELESLRALQRVYSSYETYDTPDHPMIQRMAQIYVKSQRDFHVVRLYIGMLLWHGDQLFLPLSKDIRWRQILALRRRWNVPDYQHMAQDMGWAFFNPGNRRWYTTETIRKTVKTDPAADHRRHERDLGRTTKVDEEIRIVVVSMDLWKRQCESEQASSMNMNRVSYDSRDGMLYAKTRSEPSLRCVQNRDSTTPDTNFIDPEAELIAMAEAYQRSQDDVEEDDDNDLASNSSDMMDVDCTETEQNTSGGVDIGVEHKLLYRNEDLSIYVTLDEKARQIAVLNDSARKQYRKAKGPPYLYDSRCTDPLVAVDLVGVVKYLNDKLYTLCVVCGCVTSFTSANITTIGPCCGSHDFEANYKRNRHFLHMHERVPLPSGLFRKAAELSDRETAPSEAPSQNNEPERQGSYLDIIKCVFCRSAPQLASPLSNHKHFEFIVTDPQTRQVRQETHAVCKTDYNYAKKLLDPGMVRSDRPADFHITAPTRPVIFEDALRYIRNRRMTFGVGRKSKRRYRPGW